MISNSVKWACCWYWWTTSSPRSVIYTSRLFFLLSGLWNWNPPFKYSARVLWVWMFWHLAPELFCLQDRLAGPNKHNEPRWISSSSSMKICVITVLPLHRLFCFFFVFFLRAPPQILFNQRPPYLAAIHQRGALSHCLPPQTLPLYHGTMSWTERRLLLDGVFTQSTTG